MDSSYWELSQTVQRRASISKIGTLFNMGFKPDFDLTFLGLKVTDRMTTHLLTQLLNKECFITIRT